jgi:hypothetical protein
LQLDSINTNRFPGLLHLQNLKLLRQSKEEKFSENLQHPEAYRIGVAYLFCEAKQQKSCHSSCANAKGLLLFEENFSTSVILSLNCATLTAMYVHA